eukprot:gene39027-6601_t
MGACSSRPTPTPDTEKGTPALHHTGSGHAQSRSPLTPETDTPSAPVPEQAQEQPAAAAPQA